MGSNVFDQFDDGNVFNQFDMAAPKNAVADTNAWQTQIKNDLVGNNGFWKNALIGSGKFFSDLGLGARQIYAKGSDLITGGNGSQALEQEAADKRAIDAPVMHTVGGRVGQIGTGVLTALPLSAIPGANTYTGAAVIGGGYGALTPTTANDSRALNTTIGAGLGVAGKYAGDKLGAWLASRQSTPVQPSGLTRAQQQAASQGQTLGMEMTPGQASGNRALQQLEAKLESQPWTSGPFNAIKSQNQSVLNSTVANAIGENSNSVDSTVLANAADRLGQIFESVRDPSKIVATNPQATTQALDAIDQNAQGLISGSIRDNPLVKNLEILTSQGSINGEQLGSLSSKLGRAAFKQMSQPSGDRDLGQALYAVKEHVDDLVQSSLSQSEQAAYAAARSQYRNLMNITSRIGIVNPSSGNVSGANLANKLQQIDKQGFLFGKNQSPMYSAARFAQAFKPIVGDSGTATRSWNSMEFLPGMAANLATRAYLTRPGSAIAQAALSAPTALSNAGAASSRTVAPFVQSGLPALSETLVPYLTQ